MAHKLGPGHTIVTMLCDVAGRYSDKLYNPLFLKQKGLSVPPWLESGADRTQLKGKVLNDQAWLDDIVEQAFEDEDPDRSN